MTPESYCRDKVAPPGSTLYYSLRKLEPARRDAVLGLHALAKELHDTVYHVADTGVARIKLDWWREELQHCFSGNARHPVSQALSGAVRDWNLPEEYFAELVDGMESVLLQPGFATFNQLALYCHRVAGSLGLMTSEILGYRHRQTPDFAARLGTALTLTGHLNHLARDISQGHIRIPGEELQRFGISEAHLLARTNSAQMENLLAFQSDRAHRYFREALDLLPDADRERQTPLLILAAIHQAVLAEIDKNRLAVLNQTMDLTPLRKLWIAWATARKARRKSA